MMRKIIKIDEEKCNGCELCVKACHEGAIGMLNGKARLLRDDYCDGLGDCLPVCPTGAISFEEREAAAFDEAEVKKNMEQKNKDEQLPCGCPGSNSKSIERVIAIETASSVPNVRTQLNQWPVQIKLVPTNAPYFENANLLIAADCTSYAYGNFHDEFMKNRITLIGCPKLDEVEYSEKVEAIIRNNNLNSITVIRMEVPCCAGIEVAVKTALKNSGKMVPYQVITISTDGNIIGN